jgi:nucleotide-binding universal stress UspA family protein
MSTLEIEKSATFKNVLVATDFSDASTHALHSAAAIAEENDAELFVLHVAPPEPHLAVPLDPLPEEFDDVYLTAKHRLNKLSAAESLAHLRHQEIIERGQIGGVVADVIRKKEIDLLVVGTHGRTGFAKVVLGSVAEELFRSASCPVLTVGPAAGPNRKIQRVLFATDFAPSSLHALPYALGLANKDGGELFLLHLVSPIPVNYVGPGWFPDDGFMEREQILKKEALKKLESLVPRQSDVKCRIECLVSLHFAAEGIIQAVKNHNVDLVVMGIRDSAVTASRLAAHLPWATAYEVVCTVACPVLTIRG